MSEPVDTDALEEAWKKYAARNDIHPLAADYRSTFEAGWCTAGGEAVRLHNRLQHVENWTVPEAIRTWRKEHAEVDRLRAVIENAPHAEDCPAEYGCTCWKADV